MRVGVELIALGLLGADLIVLGTREPNRLYDLVNGTVSEQVARSTRRNLLVAHLPHPGKRPG